MPGSIPDENGNKKRRNLMLTVSAILISAFLKLPVPTAIISAMNIAQPESMAWKIWAIAMAILGYQIWRFWTDSDTSVSWSKARAAYRWYKGVDLAKLLHSKLKSVANGKRTWLDDVTWESHAERDGQSLQYSGFLFSYQDESGSLVNAVESPADRGRVRVAFTADYRPSRDEIGAIGTLDYKLGIISRWRYRTTALGSAFLRSEAMQDCTVPILLAIPAIFICGMGINSNWQ